MADFPRVKAVQFHRQMDSGRTQPYLMTCVDSHGQAHEYVVKLEGSIGKRVVREAWCAVLAKMLDLPLPAAALVDIDPKLGKLNPNFGAVLSKANGPHFGSEFISAQTVLFTGGYGIPPGQVSVAVAIFAFDYLIQNPDRRVDNSNIVIVRDELRIIDHELALAVDDVLGGCPMPWELGRTDRMWVNHILYRELRTKIRMPSQADIVADGIDTFMGRLRNLSADSIINIAASLPIAWNYSKCNSLIQQYLVDVLDDLSSFERGLREVLG